MPELLRVGAAEALAYRAEFVVWMLTSTLPLIMLGLWTSVASEAPFGRWDSDDFVAYYLGAMVVRNLTGTWVIWQLDDEIRRGTLSMRLLRPIHPFVTFAATHLSAVPLRAIVAIPFALLLLALTDQVTGDPALLAICALSLAGAWALTFFVLLIIGTMGFFIERSLAVFGLYMGVFALLSGYLVPLELLPGWAQAVAAAAPFRYMLACPIETGLGYHDVATAAGLLARQWAFVAAVVVAAILVWNAGVRRYEAFGA